MCENKHCFEEIHIAKANRDDTVTLTLGRGIKLYQHDMSSPYVGYGDTMILLAVLGHWQSILGAI